MVRMESTQVWNVTIIGRPCCAPPASAPRLPVRLLFCALFAAVPVQPTNEPSDHESGQQKRDDHAYTDEHIGENYSGAALDGHDARRRFASSLCTVSGSDRLAGDTFFVRNRDIQMVKVGINYRFNWSGYGYGYGY